MVIDSSMVRSGSERARVGRFPLLFTVFSVLLLLPMTGQAAIPVALYPVQGPATEKSRTDVRELIRAGLLMAERRQVFTARKPLVGTESCASPATTECLAGLAGKGAIIYALARDTESAVEVTLVLVTADGKRTKELRFENGRFFQDDRVGGRAIEALENAYLQLATPPPAVAVTAPAQPSQVDLLPSQEPLDQVVETYPSNEAPASPWKMRAAIGCGAGGALLFGGGVVFGLLAKGLNGDLTSRYQSHSLVPEDRAKYDHLKTYNVLATTMMIGGGVLAAAGVTFWALAPSASVSSDHAAFSVGGTF
jgi:hypothetical protein